MRGNVTAIQKKDGDRPPVLNVDFTTIEVRGQRIPLTASLTSAEADTEKKVRDVEARKSDSSGGAAGAIKDGIVGAGVEFVDAGKTVGEAVGDAVGTGVTMVTRQGHGVLPAGTAMEIRMDESLEVRM